MDRTTAERFLLLAHHPEKKRYVLQEQMRNAGMIGAFLLDLSFENKIRIQEDRLIVNSTNTSLPLPHQQVLQKISAASRPKKLRYWISRFAQAPWKYKKGLVKVMERKGILRVEEKHFLFIPYYRTMLIKPALRQQLISEIREIVFQGKKPEGEIALILGLIQACRMHKIICQDKGEVKECKARLKVLMESDAISIGVEKVIREMQAALIGALGASSIAATVSAHR